MLLMVRCVEMTTMMALEETRHRQRPTYCSSNEEHIDMGTTG